MVAILIALALAPGHPQEVPLQGAVVSVTRVWDRAAHSAFTDMVAAPNGRLYLAFREGTRHVHGVDGTVRVVSSAKGHDWRHEALFELEGTDLRDPKLSLLPLRSATDAGTLMVTMAGSVYRERRLVERNPQVGLIRLPPGHGRVGAPRMRRMRIDEAMATRTDWLWRTTWHDGKAWGVVYQTEGESRGAHLMRSDDGDDWSHHASFELDGRPNETTIRFTPDDRMVALVRREGGDKHAMLGTSAPPHREWTWHDLGHRIGGPNLIRLPDGTWIAGGRRYLAKGAKTALARVTLDGGFEWILTLPSGGDTSYPGFVIREDRLLVSYYSSHEGKAAIYLANLRWKKLAIRKR